MGRNIHETKAEKNSTTSIQKWKSLYHERNATAKLENMYLRWIRTINSTDPIIM